MGNKKKRRSLSTFAILIVVLLLVSAATWLASGQTYTDAETGEQAVVVGASLSDILMAPIGGWHDAGDVIGFVFCLGAFLSILNATGVALNKLPMSPQYLVEQFTAAGLIQA